MKFAFTLQQQMISDTANAFLNEVSTSKAVRKAMAGRSGHDQQAWQRLCGDMCWQATHIPEQYGGLGLGYVELAVLLEPMGRYLLCSPFFSTVCLGANALLMAGTQIQKQHYLTKICAGTLTATLAYTSRAVDYTLDQWGADAIQTYYKKVDGDYYLNGTLCYVTDGSTADLMIVAARKEGSVGVDEISLFVIPATMDGLSRQYVPTMDQTRKQAQIMLNNVRVSNAAIMKEEENAWPLLEKIIALALIATAAEQMGGAQHLLDITVDYTKHREQFGRPIAGFQAIKHQAADMMLKTQSSRSAVYYAACVAQEALQGGALAAELIEAAHIAKSYCSDAYLANAAVAMQLHGGVGFTWEYDVHLYFKRAKSSDTYLGDSAYHREKLATLLLDDVTYT